MRSAGTSGPEVGIEALQSTCTRGGVAQAWALMQRRRVVWHKLGRSCSGEGWCGTSLGVHAAQKGGAAQAWAFMQRRRVVRVMEWHSSDKQCWDGAVEGGIWCKLKGAYGVRGHMV